MLCNSEKMPITTEWTHPDAQLEQIRGAEPAMTANTTKLIPDPSPQDQQQNTPHHHHHHPHQQPALKCPRCDSSNTKFCYYNNYSLSQPRHFCKACKRYWTRGGTLRNVPVGGGCRKNKRLKRPSSSSSGASASAAEHAVAAAGSSSLPTNINPSDAASSVYGVLPTNTSDLIPFPALRSRVSSSSSSGFDNMSLIPQLGSLNCWMPAGEYPQFNPNQIHDDDSSSLLPDFSLLGSSAFALQTQKLGNIMGGSNIITNLKESSNNNTCRPSSTNDFQVFFPNMGGLLHPNGGGGGGGGILKGVKMEEESKNNSMGTWQIPNYEIKSMENNIMGSDSSVYWTSSTTNTAWPDHATNYGSSITPLI
ncbi:hypothetical protein H6P81_019446 [Aristolochia fimbriata]|uniref:Dof zinc finger protein n=1 Tax=Aristolochia fimbriata TaxID=158543 RepID=A0AAV7DSV6_ARIFI|nr:hypothetical protein H6P81_019446 [Aristolochia fimbriata]